MPKLESLRQQFKYKLVRLVHQPNPLLVSDATAGVSKITTTKFLKKLQSAQPNFLKTLAIAIKLLFAHAPLT